MVNYNYNSSPKSTHKNNFISPFNPASFVGSGDDVIPDKDDNLLKDPIIHYPTDLNNTLKQIELDLKLSEAMRRTKEFCKIPEEELCKCLPNGCYDMTAFLILPTSLFAEQHGPYLFYVGKEIDPPDDLSPGTLSDDNEPKEPVKALGNATYDPITGFYNFTFDITRPVNWVGMSGSYNIQANIEISCMDDPLDQDNNGLWMIAGEFHISIPRNISQLAGAQLAEIDAIRAFKNMSPLDCPETYEWHAKLHWNNSQKSVGIFAYKALDVICDDNPLSISLKTESSPSLINFYDIDNEFSTEFLDPTVYYNKFGQVGEQSILSDPPPGTFIELPLTTTPSAFNINHGCWSWITPLDFPAPNQDGDVIVNNIVSFNEDGSNDPYAPFNPELAPVLCRTLGNALINLIGLRIKIQPYTTSFSDWSQENNLTGLTLQVDDFSGVDPNGGSTAPLPLTTANIEKAFIGYSSQIEYDPFFYNVDGGYLTFYRKCALFDVAELRHYQGTFGTPNLIPIKLKYKDGYQDILSSCDVFGWFEIASRGHNCPTNLCSNFQTRYKVFKIDRQNLELIDITHQILEDGDPEDPTSEKLINQYPQDCQGAGAPCNGDYLPFLPDPELYFAPIPSPSPSP